MPRSRRSADTLRRVGRALGREDGNAALEFIGAGVLLLVPILYLVVAVGAVQAGALGVEGAARQSARMVATAASADAAARDAEAAVAVTLADYGLDAGAATVSLSCAPTPANCLSRNGRVSVTVSSIVPLPLFPVFLGMSAPPGIPVSSTATQPVSRFHPAAPQP
ncbi:MAG: TadE family protein [Micrococcales bacterium]|nr:TadE family protein [Micrococcales bacterium]